MRSRFLKQQSVFLVGFGIGFIPVLLFYLLKNLFITDFSYNQKSLQPLYYLNENRYLKELILWRGKKEKRHSNFLNNVTYNTWLAEQNLKLYKIDLDKYLYGPKEKENAEDINITEWNWLREHVSITCVVFVEKIKLGKSIYATWGKRCNNIYFFGHNLKNAELPVINVNKKIASSWQLLCEAMNYIWNDKLADKLKWVIFVKDDTIVIPENLRYIIAPLDHKDDYYMGHPIVMWGHTYNIAQAGYVLSRGAFVKIVQMFNNTEKCATGGKYWKKEDYYLGKHLSSLGIHPSDTRDRYLRGTFHGYSLQTLLWGVAKADSYWIHAVYPTQGACCSPISVTFSVNDPDKMHTLNYLLYHLHVFISKNRFGNIPAVISIPERNVWKVALKEEFNITHLSDISSDAYYEIWHSKYSEPGQLINKNYQMTPGALKCLLESYKANNKSINNSMSKNCMNSTKN